MSARLILAHDLGTGGDKASLHDSSGRLIAATSAGYPTDYGPGGKAEQDPDDWWDAFVRTTRTLLADSGTRPEDVACVSFAGHMQGAVLVDEAGEPVRPAIIWADTRAKDQCAALIDRVGMERAYELTGHRLDATYTLSKVCWVRDNEPDGWERVATILQAKDFLVLRLTGRRVTEPSDASGTNAFDQHEAVWSEELLGAAGVNVALFPEVVPSATIVGGITRSAAEVSGLREGTPVVCGGGDGACAALGAGLVGTESGANLYLGSSAWISIASERPLRDALARTMTFGHVIPGRYIPIGTMQSGGGSLDWALDALGATVAGDRDALIGAAQEVEAAAGGLFFLPYLLGERSPLWEARARGAFVGLSRLHGPPHLMRAVLEGVAFNLRTILLALVEVGGPIAAVDAIGGGAKSPTWLRIISDVLGVTVRRRSLGEEATALGAAVVGGIGVGLIDGWEHAAELSDVIEVLEPRPERAATYERAHQRFLEATAGLLPWYRGAPAGPR